MSADLEHSLTIKDGDDDRAVFESGGMQDEDIDWSDDDAAYLARVSVGGIAHVNISRNDLRALIDFLVEIEENDRAVLGVAA